MLEVSVIICSHNPRPVYLRKVLRALNDQTLSKTRWELLLVDNASDKSLKEEWDLGWHPQGRHLFEERLGLTSARIAGIKQAQAELLVFVDDDNQLAPDYLETAHQIAEDFHQMGAFGCSITGEFETPVPDWAIPYLEGLCLREIARDRWANEYSWSEAVPYGAGMCVRSAVARRYRDAIQNEPLRQRLDRSGTQLISGGDLDLAWTAIDLGLGTGRFHRLKAIHLIPAERLTQEYLVRLHSGFSYSNTILWAVRGLLREKPTTNWRDTLRLWGAFLRLRGVRRQIFFGSRRASKAALQLLESVSETQ